MKKNYKLQNTNHKGGGTPGLLGIPNHNVQNYKPNGNHSSMHLGPNASTDSLTNRPTDPLTPSPGSRRQKSCITALLLLILVMVLPALAQTDDVKHYLLMQEIQEALKNAKLFKSISETKISVNLESPFLLHGYFPIDKFIDDFTLVFSGFETQGIEWVSMQLEEQFTVQSLSLVLKDKRSEKTVYYKLIFFLAKKDNEWKIYYLRGLKI
jgi:hypothetical protein